MKYCVRKGTRSVIDGSTNPEEIMIQNALSAGFSVEEIEILEEAEFLEREVATD